MAAHHLTIAKASFAAACLRPDVTKVARDDLSRFHASLEAATTQCSPSNIQSCKQWVLEHVAPSSQRCSALGKYLASLSKSVSSEASDESLRQNDGRVSASRKCLHVLYIVSDILHHVKYHTADNSLHTGLIEGLRPYTPELFQYAAKNDRKRVKIRLQSLVKIWRSQAYYNDTTVDQIDRVLSNNDNPTLGPVLVAAEDGASSKEPAYIMPFSHGDPATPYYDLPAANFMPHIVPNSATPMRPDLIRALQLSGGAADEGLVNAVKDFLKDVERINNPYASLEDSGVVADMDELGQVTYRDEADGVIGDTYYGWSREFCDKMRKRRQDVRDGRPSRESDSGASPYKRRRSSSSMSRSRSRSRSHYRRRSPSYSPRGSAAHTRQNNTNSMSRAAGQFLSQGSTSFVPADGRHQAAFPASGLGSDSMHTIPPRPPGWTNGPWPPPPPPPGLAGGLDNMQFPPPPPPPPPTTRPPF